jgi:hypothetical protein
MCIQEAYFNEQYPLAVQLLDRRGYEDGVFTPKDKEFFIIDVTEWYITNPDDHKPSVVRNFIHNHKDISYATLDMLYEDTQYHMEKKARKRIPYGKEIHILERLEEFKDKLQYRKHSVKTSVNAAHLMGALEREIYMYERYSEALPELIQKENYELAAKVRNYLKGFDS